MSENSSAIASASRAANVSCVLAASSRWLAASDVAIANDTVAVTDVWSLPSCFLMICADASARRSCSVACRLYPSSCCVAWLSTLWRWIEMKNEDEPSVCPSVHLGAAGSLHFFLTFMAAVVVILIFNLNLKNFWRRNNIVWPTGSRTQQQTAFGTLYNHPTHTAHTTTDLIGPAHSLVIGQLPE